MWTRRDMYLMSSLQGADVGVILTGEGLGKALWRVVSICNYI